MPKINFNGFVNKFNILFKNVTTESDNSTEFANDFRSQNYGSILYDISFPMKKEGLKSPFKEDKNLDFSMYLERV